MTIHDLGGIAATRVGADGKTERGFALYVGGGLGAVPHQAKLFSEFVPEEELLPLSRATWPPGLATRPGFAAAASWAITSRGSDGDKAHRRPGRGETATAPRPAADARSGARRRYSLAVVLETEQMPHGVRVGSAVGTDRGFLHAHGLFDRDFAKRICDQ